MCGLAVIKMKNFTQNFFEFFFRTEIEVMGNDRPCHSGKVDNGKERNLRPKQGKLRGKDVENAGTS